MRLNNQPSFSSAAPLRGALYDFKWPVLCSLMMVILVCAHSSQNLCVDRGILFIYPVNHFIFTVHILQLNDGETDRGISTQQSLRL